VTCPALLRTVGLPVALALGGAAHAQQAACAGGVAAGFPCSNVDLMARLPIATFGPGAVRASEIWGWTDPQTGREYAIMGLIDAAVFVDVTDPAAPVYVGRLPSTVPDPVYGRWRVLRVYQDHVFVGSEIAGHGVQVFDLTRLRSVASPPQTFTADARYAGNSSAHTLVIDEATGYLYIAGGTSPACGGGLHIVDVRTPTAPTYAGCFDDDGYVHEAQCLVYDGPDADHQGRELCVAYNVDHVAFVDVTDKASPTLIASAFYPSPSYTHQGWFTEDRRHLLVDDELDETSGPFATARTVVLNVEDLDNPTYVGAHFSTIPSTDHNQYVRGRYTFQSNNAAGLRILDLTDVASAQLTEVAHFDTHPAADEANAATGLWMSYPYFASGTIVGSDRNNGLFVLRPTFDIVAADPRPLPAGFALSAPAPNPARDRAALSLTVERAQTVRAEAFDALGRRVAVLYDGPAAAGAVTELVLEAAGLVPGPYLVRVTGETFTTARPLAILR
jgi:choice-of-anchor B domain-containing protein